MSSRYLSGLINNPTCGRSYPTPTVEYLVVAGGGGGGGAGVSGYAGGQSGGSGIVIIRYPNTYKAAASTTNATYSTTGTWIVYTFTQSGSITL